MKRKNKCKLEKRTLAISTYVSEGFIIRRKLPFIPLGEKDWFLISTEKIGLDIYNYLIKEEKNDNKN